MPVPPPGGRAANGPALTTADGRPIDLVPQEESGRDIRQALKVGSVVSGRVIERFDGNTYLFNLRGRNMIAQSKTPLLRDSVARFAVLGTNDGIRLRLLDGSHRDSASTTGQAQRLTALGLPQQASAQIVLQAFEQAGSVLDRVRLQRASQDVAQLPVAQQGLRAAAHAALARAGLPTTPLLVQLAEQSQRPGLPQVASNLLELPRSLSTQLLGGQLPGGQLPGGKSLADSGRSTGGLTTNPGASTGPGSSGQAQHIAQQAAQAQAPAQSAGAAQSAQAGGSPGLASQANAGNSGSSAGSPLAAAATLTGTAAPATAGASSSLLTAGAAWGLPDLAGGDRHAADAALRLAGIRPDAGAASAHIEPNGETSNASASTHQRADMAAAQNEAQDARSLVAQLVQLARTLDALGDSQRSLTDPVHQALRDSIADSLLPPAHLDDYDLVLPLPMTDQGRAQHGRIALSQRPAGSAGTASFVRIDLDLPQLGPLSVRLNAIEGSPVSMLLLATGRGLNELQSQHADLAADLEQQGVEASIRFGDLLAHGGQHRHYPGNAASSGAGHR